MREIGQNEFLFEKAVLSSFSNRFHSGTCFHSTQGKDLESILSKIKSPEAKNNLSNYQQSTHINTKSVLAF